MNKRDYAALELALEHTLAETDAGRVEQVRDMLADPSRTRLEVLKFCSFHRQMATLKLRPWDAPPCCAERASDDDGGAAMRLLERMRKARVSKWHPDPLAAIEVAEKAAGAV
jgi:hypothetical protein